MMSFCNSPIQRLLRFSVLFAFGSALAGSGVFAQTGSPLTPSEARTARAFEAAKKLGAPELYAFLKPMPKGADLHMHLSGAVYAETFIAEAVKQGLCVDPKALALAPSATGKDAPCGPGNLPASSALKDQKLYDALIDAFSMRSFVPSSGISGHDQFFSTFDHFRGLNSSHAGEWLDEVVRRAAVQNEQYLEVMQTPTFTHAATLGYNLGWPEGAEKTVTPQQLAKLRTDLLSGGVRDEVSVDSKELADAESARRAMEGCEGAQPNPVQIQGMEHDPCTIQTHWLYQVLRGFPPQQVFAQTLLGFEVASADPDVVGINFVMPEDGRVSMQDYHLQMQMLDYLHSVYPKVRLSLHAGEIAPGMVTPDGLRFHIREAIDLGHAERIGHGMDVLYEDHPSALLKEMADKHVMVEINLTSNDVILGLTRTDHPLAAYRAAHVPVALSTDDEGVSRIDLTHEYVKGAEEQGLTYVDLKQMARTSLEHAFLAGESLWAAPDSFTRRKAACAASITSISNPTSACAVLLKSSERAAEQWELERRFALFEASIH
ncbi:adenosine deaminase [Granulicella mallensis]|uniref:adenosine deaminase n=1 Tax=Granulicella mallensis TaxID=940614 RepID=A0A7W8E9F0_9BACT|nr:adenosine deaminase [Granulicella mallensis]MBB5063707.1 adenosine deaminase [Granulicella mallensis]